MLKIISFLTVFFFVSFYVCLSFIKYHFQSIKVVVTIFNKTFVELFA